MSRDKTHKLQLHKTLKSVEAKINLDKKKGMDPYRGGKLPNPKQSKG